MSLTLVDRGSSADVAQLAARLRVDAIRASAAAGWGHPTSAMSAADVLAVLAARHLRFDPASPHDPRADHLVFSKGHAAALLYALLRAAGVIGDEELLTLGQHGSRLHGHPLPPLPLVDVATGSLGQGLPISVGLALGAHLSGSPSRVWVLCGDSEMAEGSNWEALEHAAYLGLANVTCIVDVNGLGLCGPTMQGHDTGVHARRARAFGWNAIEFDGHDIAAIEDAFREATTSGTPTMLLARTHAGAGVSDLTDREDLQGHPLPDPSAAIAAIGDPGPVQLLLARPHGKSPMPLPPTQPSSPAIYEPGADTKISTDEALGAALQALMTSRPDVVVLDAEAGLNGGGGAHHFQMYVAQQQLLASAVGLQARGWTPFAATAAATVSRAHDFTRMAAIGGARLCLCGTDCGLGAGAGGPAMMALEDIAAMRALPGSVVLCPSDPNQTTALAHAMADHRAITYMRTSSVATGVLYGPGERFHIGGAVQFNAGTDDRIALIAAGATLHEALHAVDLLALEGIAARAIDMYSVKPLNIDVLRDAALNCGHLVVVEDHRPEGGLGSAVLEALSAMRLHPTVRCLAVDHIPGSGAPSELLHECGIDAINIAVAAREMVAA